MLRRFALPTAIAAPMLAAIALAGCGQAATLLYKNTNQQAIQRDTVAADGQIASTVQDPQFAANGTVRLAAVESLGLVEVPLQVPEPPPGGKHSAPLDRPRTLMVPPGFTASVYAHGLGEPRDLALREDGVLFFSEQDDGQILALHPDRTISVIASDLKSPHGVELHEGALYFTDERRVFRFDFESPTSVAGTLKVISDNLPEPGRHKSRTIRWSPTEKKFYITSGSSCSACEEKDPSHGTVVRIGADGGTVTRAMRGLRNTLAMDVHPQTGDLWGIDIGVELLSTDLPPDEVNILKVGKHYGWPYYYGENFRHPDFLKDTARYIERSKVETPVINLQAHSEPIDMQFYRSAALGPEWRNSAIIAYHGAFTRIPLTGFKVVRLRADADGGNARQADMVTGFVVGKEEVWARPAGIAIAGDGKTFYISDDYSGLILKIAAP